jgi:CubicO group peptidase (beta-lactamase class C family)
MKDGRSLYERGYGIADLDHDVKITPTTVFHVGSMSKQFTAAAILMLAQQGKISLDDPIRKYVPEVPDFGVPITLRHLLHHTSGLRDQWELLGFDGWRVGNDLITDGDVLYVLSRQKELNFSPGSEFMYCNSGYTLLAQVVDRVSGQSLRDFTTLNLFQPLGMKHTHFRDNHGETVKQIAYGYEPRDNDFELSVPNYDTVGATSLLTTVEDLNLWDENFYTAQVGGDRLIKQLQEPSKLNDGTPLDYAAGLFIYHYRGLKIVDHSGGDAGYVADMMRFPDQHFSVASLCNLSSIDPSEMNRHIADIYLAGELAPASSGNTSFQPKLDQLRSKVGIYVEAPGDWVIHLQLRNGELWADSGVGPSSKLEALSENRFRIPEYSVELDFGKDDSHLIWTKKIEELGTNKSRQFDRVTAYSPTSAQLRDFVGTYRSAELDVPYLVTLDHDRLTMHPPKAGDLPLVPVTTDLFVGSSWRVRFTRDTKGHVSGFLINTARTRNLRFERSPT